MDTAQILPNYHDRYSQSGCWSKFETTHYLFHFFKDSLAEEEIGLIAEIQEKAFTHILAALALSGPKEKIRYYFYPTEEDKERFMGDGGYGQAIWRDYSIHAVYNTEAKVIGAHEDTHLLVLEWGGSPIGLLSEGLAEYMGGCMWKGSDSTPLARKAVEQHIFGSFEHLFAHQFWMDTPDEDADLYYALAGTFTRYLVGEKGMDTYRTLYQSLRREHTLSQNTSIFEELYGSIPDIAEGYARSLERDAQISAV